MKEFIAAVKARYHLLKLRLTDIWRDYGRDGKVLIILAGNCLLIVLLVLLIAML